MGVLSWGGLLAPRFSAPPSGETASDPNVLEVQERARGPHLIQCHLGQGLPPYQVASWSMKPFGHNTRVLQTTGDRQTTSHDNSRTLHCNSRLIMRFVIFIIHQGLENIGTILSRPRPRPRLFLQDQDQNHISCPRGASRPRPRSQDYIPVYNTSITVFYRTRVYPMHQPKQEFAHL